MRKLHVALSALALVAMLLVAHRALACQCVGGTFEDAFRRADVVFVAEVTGRAPTYSAKVEGVWKGKVPATVTLDVAGDGNDCMIGPLRKTGRWLILAGSAGSVLKLSFCSGSQPATAALEAELTKAHGAPTKP